MASLLDLRLSQWGLPDFGDRVEGAVPLQPPWTLHGKVVKGFGRGSKELGIPTANVDAAALQVAAGMRCPPGLAGQPGYSWACTPAHRCPVHGRASLRLPCLSDSALQSQT